MFVSVHQTNPPRFHTIFLFLFIDFSAFTYQQFQSGLSSVYVMCVHSVASQCTAQVGCSDQNEARSIKASAWSWPFKFLTNQKVVFRILITNLLIFQISLFSSCNFQFIIHSESSFSERRITFSDRWLDSQLLLMSSNNMQSSMGLTIRRGTRCALHSSCDGVDNLLLGAGKSEIDRATRKSCAFCWGVFINKQSTRIDATGI